MRMKLRRVMKRSDNFLIIEYFQHNQSKNDPELIIIIMFSKIRKFGSGLLSKPKFYFTPKKSLKQRMRHEVFA